LYVFAMSGKTHAMPSVRITHKLSPAEVRGRMAARIDDLHKLLPGGAGAIEAAWEDDDRLSITVCVMSLTINCAAEIEPDALVIHYALPGGAAFVAPMVEGVIRKAGDKLLLDKG
jgi:Putative polyhydroxyalkanoic acid system protein (PHA_gran_rgn)